MGVGSGFLGQTSVDEAAASGVPWVWLVGLLVAALLVGVGVLLGRRARALPAPERQSLARPGIAELPRPEVDAPVAITDDMSLREVREAKRVRLSGAYKASDAVQGERERRKGITLTADVPILSPPAAPGDGGADAALTDAIHPTEEDGSESADPAQPRVATLIDGGQLAAAAMTAARTSATAVVPASAAATAPDQRADSEAIAAGLARTRSGFAARLGALFQRKKLDSETLEELEELLFTADIGVATSTRLLRSVESHVANGEADPAAIWALLRAEILEILLRPQSSWSRTVDDSPLAVVMMVGVNGAGKTTTIGKLAARYARRGRKVLVIAGDTFRAAAADQLEEWARRVGCEIFRGPDSSDPSGVVFDGLQHAKQHGFNLVLIDTAGRLQNRRPLMDELRKVAKVADRAVSGAPHETVLVVDANTGQNAIQQARQFGEATPLTGVVLTKLDGTAKGGVVIGISDELGLPIQFVGIGEAIEDLRPFSAAEFADALF